MDGKEEWQKMLARHTILEYMLNNERRLPAQNSP